MPVALVIILVAAGLATAATALVLRETTQTGTGLRNVPPVRLLPRLAFWTLIALELKRRGARVTSVHREDAVNEAVNGRADSKHTEAGALDFVDEGDGSATQYAWALHRAGIIEKPLVHDVGSGVHVHLELEDKWLT